eukprot:SAG25_NODE_10334_length_338_cov_0.577406_1_plen_36_part_01
MPVHFFVGPRILATSKNTAEHHPGSSDGSGRRNSSA